MEQALNGMYMNTRVQKNVTDKITSSQTYYTKVQKNIADKITSS
jgi:hypothetical protein